MIESRLSQVQEQRSVLEQDWPPKWFFSYADLATQLMTFFVVLATMLSLNIPLFVFADKEAQAYFAPKEIEKAHTLTQAQQDALRLVRELKVEQIKEIFDLSGLKTLALRLKEFIKENHLEEDIQVEESAYKLRVVPSAPFFFAPASDLLSPSAKKLLDSIAVFMQGNPSIQMRIEGHTDAAPIHSRRFASNWELSAARANRVMRYLVKEYQIPATRLQAVGYGEFQPVAPNDSEKGRAKNRRVVIELLPDYEALASAGKGSTETPPPSS